MTRINLVHPAELCDQHLLAEWRELTRIPNGIANGVYKIILDEIPQKYTIRTEDNPEGGKGHVKFFLDKLCFLFNRYQSLKDELHQRGIVVGDMWSKSITKETVGHLWNDYKPSQRDIDLNRTRIKERYPKKPRYAKEKL